ncbi:MAG: tocopherol O-methyltransferase [Saprospiraceae bacterium]|jgi:tocopherol O-methyltransferase
MTLNQKIKKFYDQSTPLWLEVWGEHMHHGYYENGKPGDKTHTQAQLDLVDEMLRWGNVEQANVILDAGCGVGGSARLLAKKFDAKVLGVTLSPVQAENGQAYSKVIGLQEQVIIEVKDMMSLVGSDKKFDLIWSMESAEHIADKKALVDMFYDLLEPGGKLLMATWCHRDEPPILNNEDRSLLKKIYQLYHLPPMVAVDELEEAMKASGFSQVQTADWSDNVAPFWKAVIRSVFSLKSIIGLLKAGLPTIQGAWAMRYMTRGYQQNLIKFGVFQGTKI